MHKTMANTPKFNNTNLHFGTYELSQSSADLVRIASLHLKSNIIHNLLYIISPKQKTQK